MKNAGRGEASLTKTVATGSGLKAGQAFQSGALNGTLITDAETASPYNAVVEFSADKTVKHYVSNVLTYTGGNAEATWGAITLGQKIYYDLSGLKDDPAQASGTKIRLTTSPSDKASVTNVLYGYAMEPMTTATATVAEIEILPVR